MMLIGRFRVRWRTRGPNETPIVRWHSVAASSPDVRDGLLAACRGAVNGELMVSHEDEAGAICSVMTDRERLRRWDPDTTHLPAPVDSEWARELTVGNRRTVLIGDVRAIMRRAASEGVLSLQQAASIAHAVSLALDGAGPFSVARASG